MSVERAREILLSARDRLELMGPVYAQHRIDEALRELQPEPKVIDWQKVVDNQLPVMVSMDDGKRFPAFLRKYEPPYFPFKASACGWKYATLETGQWVFNASGENVWPDGVLVEVWLRMDGNQRDPIGPSPASNYQWAMQESEGAIIASRAVGLEEGWSYGGGE